MKERGQDPPFTTFPRFSLGDALIDPPSLCIERDGISHRVEAKVMQMLLVLAREPGESCHARTWSERCGPVWLLRTTP